MPTASSKSTAPTEARTGGTRGRPPRLFPGELFLLTEGTRESLAALAGRLHAHLDRPQPARLQDLAFTVSRTFDPALECLAIVASSHVDLRAKLARARERLADPACRRIQDKDGIYYAGERLARGGKVAFLFPGENAQYVNMLAELCLNFPEVRSAFDEADAACALDGDGFLPSALNFPAPGRNGNGHAPEEIAEWEKAVVLVHTANTAMSRLLQALHVRPDAVVGHSFGELSALEMAGVLRPGEGDAHIRYARHAYLHLRELSHERDLPVGRLLAVGGAERAQIDAVLGRYPDALRLSMENCPHQYVLCASGPAMDEVIADVEKSLVAEGAICSRLPIRRPYHTPFFEPAFPLEKAYYEEVGVHPPEIEVVSCATTEAFPSEPAAIVEVAARHWMSCVRFQGTIAKMYERGFRLFVDVGPRGNLAAFVGDVLGGVPHLAVALNRPQRSDVLQLLNGLGLLAAHGVPLRVHHLHERWGSQVVDFDPGSGAKTSRRSMAVQLPIYLPVMKAEGVVLSTPARAAAPVAAGPSAEPPAPAPAMASAPPVPAAPLAAAAAPARAMAAAPDGAAAVMVSYMDTMEQFLAVQGELLGRLLAGRAEPATPAAVAPMAAGDEFPLLGTIEEIVPGESLVARRVLDVAEDLFLNHHALGTTISTADPTLAALPLMPLVFSSELASEAARALFPNLKVIATLETQAHRAILLDRGTAALRIRVRRLGEEAGTIDLHVTFQQETGGDPRLYPVVYETRVLLAPQYPAAPAPRAPGLPASAAVGGAEPGTSRSSPGPLYPRWTFHGPLFQAVRRVTHTADEGVDGAMEVLSRSGLFRSRPNPVLEIDPVLQDALGQVVWLWGSRQPFAGFAYLPYRVGALRLYGPPLPPGTPLQLRMRVRRSDPLSVLATSEAIDPQGRVWSALEDVALREFPITSALSRLMQEPLHHYFADVQSLELSLPELGTRRVSLAVVEGFPVEILESSFGLWRRALGFLVLGPPEREEWMRMKVPARREIQWLLGRAAAKDALRSHFLETAGRSFAPADLTVRSDAAGRPVVSGGWKTGLPSIPEISISHTEGMAVAVAASADGGARVGVDAETVRPPSQDLLDGAFSPAELELLPRAAAGADARAEWVFRFWCAKEAVGKALGSGVSLDPRQFAISGLDEETGMIAVRPAAGPIVVAATFRRNDHVIAVAVTAQTASR